MEFVGPARGQVTLPPYAADMRGMRRVWTSLGVGLGLLVLAVPGWIAYNSRDLASVDESGLLVEDWPRLPPDANAAVPLAHAARLLDWPLG